ncbi:MAG TPA: riboflavin synthase [bacterium]|nr:riboflavin synthase [bacterium]
MFTGIVEGMARVREVRRPGRDARLVVDAGAVFDGEPVRIGDSVAVNGVCLTVVAFERGTFAADLSAETLARTTLGRLAPGTAVNLERPVPVTGRLGGHIVQGHVDGVGRVVALREAAEARRLEIAAPAALARYIVDKGSITVDGVSLTVAGVPPASRGRPDSPRGLRRGPRRHQSRRPGTARGRFGVALIPHTCQVTSLGSLEPGHEVNLEVDILAKYVEQLVGGLAARPRRPRRAGAGGGGR